MKKRIALIVLLILLLVVLAWGAWMIKHHMDYAITNAVFVDTEDIVNVGFQRVAGRIVSMSKKEGDWVRKGELLAKLDSKDYELSLKSLERKAEALEKSKEALEVKHSRIKPQSILSVERARARVEEVERSMESVREELEALKAQIEQLRRDRDRFWRLYKKRAVAKHDFEELDTKLKVAERKKKSLERKLDALALSRKIALKELEMAKEDMKKVKEVEKRIEETEKELLSLRERIKEAKLLISYCTLKSPITGRVAKKYKSVGDVVAPGEPIYALVDPRDIFILVLLEETKLKGVEPGCPAKIRIDALPGEEFEGVVESILPTSAAKFALVPRDISAGEFTKVVQRIPVKIRITKGDVDKLVVGMGGEVEIKRR